MIDRCSNCEFYNNCEFADNYMFCDDCEDSYDCNIRFVSCKAGYDIECNNGFVSKWL